MKNVAASIKQKLKNIAREKGVSVDFIQKRYVNERFLGRLAVSEWKDKFALKGGMMIAVWNNGDMYRPTADIDLNGIGDGDVELLENMIKDICNMKPKDQGGSLEYDDGIVFLTDNLVIRKEREGIIPGGKIEYDAVLDSSRIRMRVDVGFGNPVMPKIEEGDFPSLLSGDKTMPLPSPRILMYPPHTAIAEKLHAIVQFGLYNTRIRDYYDLYVMTTTMELDYDVVSSAIVETFKMQNREIPEAISGLSDTFVKTKAADWKRFVSNTPLTIKTPDFAQVVKTLDMNLGSSIENARQKLNEYYKPDIRM